MNGKYTKRPMSKRGLKRTEKTKKKKKCNQSAQLIFLTTLVDSLECTRISVAVTVSTEHYKPA